MGEFPRVIWITGLSGAGKSTLAQELTDRLRCQGKPVIRLDGDELRTVFGGGSGGDDHGRDRRLALGLNYAQLCRLLVDQGVTVVIATISMFREVHQWGREHIDGFAMVYLRVPLEELKRRDPKGLYRRFSEGTLKNVAGLDFPVDEPDRAEFVFDHDPKVSASDMADEIVNFYCSRGS